MLAFWTQVAEHYKNAPDNMMFEILNEPNRAMDDVWNALHRRGAGRHPQDQSHAQRDHRPGVLEQHVAGCPSSSCPQNDRHIIVTVHYYEPHAFTHQGARWAPEYVNLSGIHWGTPADLREASRRTSTPRRPGRSRTTAPSC